MSVAQRLKPRTTHLGPLRGLNRSRPSPTLQVQGYAPSAVVWSDLTDGVNHKHLLFTTPGNFVHQHTTGRLPNNDAFKISGTDLYLLSLPLF